VRRKRGNRDGSIYRRPNGTWAASVSLPGGRRKFFYAKTRDEARRKLDSALHGLDRGTFTDARGITVGSYLDQWLSETARPRVRRWTYLGYEVHVRLHLKPTLGDIRLEQLTPLHVQALLNRKLQDGLSPKSVRYIRGTLRNALNQAVRWGLVSRNAAALVDPPRVERYEIKPFTPDEARSFLSAIRGDRLEALYSVALTMGLRQGEALGLRWREIDLELGYLRVSKQLQRIDGKLQLVDPKTVGSRRTLVLPSSIVAKLRDHRIRQLDERLRAGANWRETDLVFSAMDGGALEGSTVTRSFHARLGAAGIAQRRFHDLRHSCATLLLVQGVSPRVVMDVLGHSEIGMTMNTYSHVIPELRRDAADRMDDLIRGR